MATRPEAEKPKGKNITIFVTDDLRKKVDKLRKTHFSAMQMNQFSAYLVEIGLEEEEIRFKEKEIRAKARLERAATEDKKPAKQKPDSAASPSLRTLGLSNDEYFETVKTGVNLDANKKTGTE